MVTLLSLTLVGIKIDKTQKTAKDVIPQPLATVATCGPMEVEMQPVDVVSTGLALARQADTLSEISNLSDLEKTISADSDACSILSDELSSTSSQGTVVGEALADLTRSLNQTFQKSFKTGAFKRTGPSNSEGSPPHFKQDED